MKKNRYDEIIMSASKKASVDMENVVKRLVRDNPYNLARLL